MYYVYVDYRADLNTPFYVGKGKIRRTKDFVRRNTVWHRIVAKHGVNRKIVLSLENDHDAILSEEIRLIRELKTRNYCGGANLTDGGEGVAGYKHSPERIEKLRKIAVIRSMEPEERKKFGARSRQQWADNRATYLLSKPRGSKHGRAITSENDVLDRSLRGAWSNFLKQWSTKMGITSEAVYLIVKRKTWKHIT